MNQDVCRIAFVYVCADFVGPRPIDELGHLRVNPKQVRAFILGVVAVGIDAGRGGARSGNPVATGWSLNVSWAHDVPAAKGG